jgi:hypothetical protein
MLMETAPQQKQQGYKVGIFGALAGMVVTFLLGVYVGLHPMWIPMKTSSVGDNGAPVKPPAPIIERERAHPTTMPQTQPDSK